MTQDPEYLAYLEKSIAAIKEMLEKASDTVLDNDVSKYPILVLHRSNLELGVQIVQYGNEHRWSVHASSLEEFSMKGLIRNDKLDDFMGVFKNPHTHLCLFVVEDDNAQFIFIERDKKEEPAQDT